MLNFVKLSKKIKRKMNHKEIMKRISDLNIEEYELVPKSETMNTFIEKESSEKVALYITIKKAEVKFLPGKYDKLMVIPEEIEEFKKLEEYCKEYFPIGPFLKEGSIGFKCSLELKEKLTTLGVKQRDKLDLCFSFNGVILYDGKYYPSFTLQDFEKVLNAGKKKFIV